MFRITESKLRNTIRKEYIKVLYESGAITRKQLHELDLKGKKSVEDELGGAEWYNPKTGQFEKKKQEKSQDRFSGLGAEMDRMSGRMGESDAVRTTRTAYIPKPGEKWDAPRGTSGHRRPMKAQGEAPRSDEPSARAGKGRKINENIGKKLSSTHDAIQYAMYALMASERTKSPADQTAFDMLSQEMRRGVEISDDFLDKVIRVIEVFKEDPSMSVDQLLSAL